MTTKIGNPRLASKAPHSRKTEEQTHCNEKESSSPFREDNAAEQNFVWLALAASSSEIEK
jgi:hypothetical protein